MASCLNKQKANFTSALWPTPVLETSEHVVLMTIFRAESEEVAGDWRKMLSEEHNNLCSATNNIFFYYFFLFGL
jgi:hypothetical protein